MAIQQKLQARLSQKLILTPSLQQAIKLLPMSTLELVDLLTQEVVENPLLEEVPTEEQQQADASAQVDKADPDPEPTSDRQDTWDDADYEYFFGDYLDDGYRPRAPREIKDLPPIENTLSTTSSLADHLVWQLSLRTNDDLLREIGAAVIGNLNEDGYLVASIDEIAAMGAWPAGEVERGAEARPDVRSGGRGGPRSAGVPPAPDPPPRARRHPRARPSSGRSTTCGCCSATRARSSRAVSACPSQS